MRCVRRWMFRAGMVVVLWFLAAWIVPFPHHKLDHKPQNTRYLDQKGRVLRRELAEEGLDSDWISLSETGEWAGQALISVEDKRFYSHHGIDPIALARATGQNVFNLRVISGASTISTQVIRMIEPRPRNLLTKCIEAFRATQLELHYDKDFILEQYLNRAPFGGNRQGIATASRRYYGKEAQSLSAGEAALLMGLPQSPSRFRPDRSPEKAEARREMVLNRMLEEKVLSEKPLLSKGKLWVPPPLKAFHFTEWISRRQVGHKGDLSTTLDGGMQRRCEETLSRLRQEPRYSATDGVGVLLIDAKTGAVKAWVGGWNADQSLQSQVDTVTRRRAPGSTLKPFAFALAMQQGWLTPDTRLEDAPRSYRDYQPQNMDLTWSGDVSATNALVQSLNMPTLQVAEQIEVARWIGSLRSLGLRLENVYAEDVGLGAVLGGGMEASLLELVQAYSCFSNQGEVITVKGLVEERTQPRSVFAPGVAYWISRMLSGPERDEILFQHGAEIVRPPFAFKTGTSHGLRDAWAIGWNEQWVLGVWVGRMDGGSVTGLSGSSHAAPILGELAKTLFESATGPWPKKSSDISDWKGRELIRGVTNPEEKQMSRVKSQIQSPPPQTELYTLDDDKMRLVLQASGQSADPVHWFINDQWIGAWPVNQQRNWEFQAGEHLIRAVFTDGHADTRSLKVTRALRL